MPLYSCSALDNACSIHTVLYMYDVHVHVVLVVSGAWLHVVCSKIFFVNYILGLIESRHCTLTHAHTL